jgi:hypothetical protein
VHDGYSLPDGKALTGGEQFPTMLRSIVSSTTLKMETQDLKGRREKVSHNWRYFFIVGQEEDITGYIKELYQGCDLENIEKLADGSLSLTSAAISKRNHFKFETELAAGSPSERQSRGGRCDQDDIHFDDFSVPKRKHSGEGSTEQRLCQSRLFSN